jgi:hypothetical protein
MKKLNETYSIRFHFVDVNSNSIITPMQLGEIKIFLIVRLMLSKAK